MSTAAKPVLGEWMPFAGVDPHTGIVPPVPATTIVSLKTTGVLHGKTPDSRIMVDVLTPAGGLVLRGHDVGSGMDHSVYDGGSLGSYTRLELPRLPGICPWVKIVELSSSGKSEFGVSSVRGSSADLPVAVAHLEGNVGFQADCSDTPTPDGSVSSLLGQAYVDASANSSVVAGFTDADMAGSAAALRYDIMMSIAESLGSNALFGGLGGLFGNELSGAEQEMMKQFGLSINQQLSQWGILGGPNGFPSLNLNNWMGKGGDPAFQWTHDSYEPGQSVDPPLTEFAGELK